MVANMSKNPMADWKACRMPLGMSWLATKGAIVRRSLGTGGGTRVFDPPSPVMVACAFSSGVEDRERSWVLVEY